MLSNVTVCGLGLGLTVWSAGLCREAGLFFPIREAGHVRVSCSLIEVCFRWPAKCRPVPMFRGHRAVNNRYRPQSSCCGPGMSIETVVTWSKATLCQSRPLRRLCGLGFASEGCQKRASMNQGECIRGAGSATKTQGMPFSIAVGEQGRAIPNCTGSRLPSIAKQRVATLRFRSYDLGSLVRFSKYAGIQLHALAVCGQVEPESSRGFPAECPARQSSGAREDFPKDTKVAKPE